MDKKQFRQIQEKLKILINHTKKEDLARGIDITLTEYKEAILLLEDKILEKLGLTRQEYEILKSEFNKKKPTSYKELVDLPEIPVMPTKEEIKELAKQVIPEPIIKTEIIKEITKEIVKEKPQVFKETKTIEIVDKTALDNILHDIRTLQLSYQNALKDIETSKQFMAGFDGEVTNKVKDLISPELNRVVRSLQSQIFSTNKNTEDLRSEFDSFSKSENLWDRTGTILSPHTANDNIDIGTGYLKASYIVNANTLTSVDIDNGQLHSNNGITTNVSLDYIERNLVYPNGTSVVSWDTNNVLNASTSDIIATSFSIGANTLTTTEWAYLDGQNQSVKTTGNPSFQSVHTPYIYNNAGPDQIVFDTINGQLNTAAGTNVISLNEGMLYDTGADYSVDWENRILYDAAGTDAILDWATAGTAQFGDSNITTTGQVSSGSTYLGVLNDLAAEASGTFLTGAKYAVLADATRAGYFTDDTNEATLANANYAIVLNGNSHLGIDDDILYLGTGLDVFQEYTGSYWDFDIAQATTAIRFNNSKFDTDFSISGDTNNDVIYFDAGSERLGVNKHWLAPVTSFHVAGKTTTDYGRFDAGVLFSQVVAPTALTATLVLDDTGNVTAGEHRYTVTYVTALGETQLGTASSMITADATHTKVNLTSIPVSTDYRVTARKIYRTIATSSTYHFKLLTTINDNVTTTYQDNTSDAGLTGGATYPGFWYQDNTTSAMLRLNGGDGVNNYLLFYAGLNNTAAGISAGASLVSPAYGNTLFGRQAGRIISTGSNNTMFGHAAGNVLTTNSQVSLFGYAAGTNLTGANTTLGGSYAGGYITSGAGNTAWGAYALTHSSYSALSTGSNNTAVGLFAGYSAWTSANSNTFIGAYTGMATTTGANSVCLGYYAGKYETAGAKLFIDSIDRTSEALGRTNSLIYGIFNSTVASQSLTINAGTLNFNAGTDTDLIINFTGTTNSGLLNWMEDEDYFKFSDDIFIGTENLYFNGTDTRLYESDDDIHLDTPANKTLVLDEVVYNDANVGALVLQTGGTLPGIVEILDNDGDATGIYTRGFAVNEQGSGCIEIPHDYKETTDLVFHVHWMGQDAPAGGTDNVKWQVTYSITRDETTTPDVITDSAETAFDTQYEWKRTDIETITGTNLKIGDQVNFTIKRIAASADEYAGEALVGTIGFHYQCDTMGSRTITTK